MTPEAVDMEFPLLDLYLDRFGGYVALLDKAGICRFISPSYQAVTGREPRYALGRPLLEDLDLVHADDRASFQQALDVANTVSTAASLTYRFLHADGYYIWLESSLVRLPDETGRSGRLAILARDVSEQRNAELEMTLLARRVIRDDEVVRREVAADLHDVVAQDLQAVKAGLQIVLGGGLEAPGASNELLSIGETIGGLLEKVRSLSSGLRPEALEFAGLVETLRAHVEKFTDMTGTETLFDCGCESTGLAIEEELAVFRVAQESMMNAFRHSAAARVEVSLQCVNGSLTLTVSDNGRGFDPGAMNDPGRRLAHLGILGMRERARMVSGELNIESSPGAGTTVRLEIPKR